MQIRSNGIALEYAEFGNRTDPALLLIRGLGTQMIRWPRELIDGFVGEGFRVVIFDNRDVGLSEKFDGTVPGTLAYTLEDMVSDVVGLIAALGIAAAHIFGISMGGMIAQQMAAKHGDQVLSLVSVMSSTGNPDLPSATDEALAVLTPETGGETDRRSAIENAVRGMKVLGSPGFPAPDAYLRATAEASYDRCYCPSGVERQLAAIQASGDRRADLREIRCPTLVIHGADDPLLHVQCGRDTAANISGAELRIIEGLGHEVNPAVSPLLVEITARFLKR